MHERCKTVRVVVSMWYNSVCMGNIKQYMLRCLCGIIRGDETYKTVRVEVFMWYNRGYIRDTKQYVLRCLCGIIGGT